MRYFQIRSMDISNGIGIGASVFLSGCHFHCKNCHNQELWDFNSGNEYTNDTKNKILKTIQPIWVERFSVLGGEPLETINLKELLVLIENIKALRPDIKIWIYTGYTYEQLQKRIKKNKDDYYLEPILRLADVLVDGPIIQEKKDLTLAFKGSSNQRVIDLQKTRAANDIVLLDM